MNIVKMIKADKVAWDEKGKKIVPIFKCLDGTEIELFRNWIYLKTEGKTIAISNGEVISNSFFLYAERFKQPYNAIFVVVYDPNADKHFFGISVSDWHDNYIGISDLLKGKFIEWVKSLPEKTINPIVEENDIPTNFEGL